MTKLHHLNPAGGEHAAQLSIGRWIAANAMAEGVGLGLTMVIGIALAPALARTESVGTLLAAALVAVVLGMLLEGVSAGVAQGLVLRSALPRLSIRSWAIATAWGAGIAWMLGMIPSTAIGILQLGTSEPSPLSAYMEPAAWLQYTLAFAMGACLGPVLAVVQVRVLRRYVARPYRWLWANSLA
jgi:hypothetical protein